ncbi:hypothetical protein ABB37_08819 [Leptomonas pyrrhocoris]|uniref:Uncharacterized protein n=1 Tax=Leptomonas pyrrhocoris TaxID=157538 RepID=A0A0M9FSM4_LEPPY|nr:hypothetical protein ABB37_08819 [Leptomonas pyrrhocoris]KPA75157.1 hypothetical protein ABB37_08819 [Leptomonas pyrrhocoris]|eukprot:XP_015653596.1 hypothetical protein ABB37_08819 [Leptomonas pyrrhocoris]
MLRLIFFVFQNVFCRRHAELRVPHFLGCTPLFAWNISFRPRPCMRRFGFSFLFSFFYFSGHHISSLFFSLSPSSAPHEGWLLAHPTPLRWKGGYACLSRACMPGRCVFFLVWVPRPAVPIPAELFAAGPVVAFGRALTCPR